MKLLQGCLMDDLPDDKEVMKMFYMTKGHLNSSIETMRSCYWGYWKRAWHNEEFYNHGQDFEKAYKERMK